MALPMRSVARAAVGGLAMGLGVAALMLLVFAVRRLGVDCAALTPTECAFETELAHGLARLQAFAALGCALVAAGLFLALRR
jgi:drug/metabolite transporter (DMT)-like permease